MGRVAVIGSGISGLVAARALARQHTVTVFEAGAQPGGHAHTVLYRGRPLDTGFLVFNEDRYPRFSTLLADLGVASRPSNMSFSVTHGDHEFGSATLSAFFASGVSAKQLALGSHILRFLKGAQRDASNPRVAQMTLKEYADDRRLSPELLTLFLKPLAGALWSTGGRDLAAFPAGFFLRFLETHGMLHPIRAPKWRTIRGGSRAYVEALVRQTPLELRLATPVTAIERRSAGVVIGSRGGAEAFDGAVLACHADDALRLLAQPTPMEKELLGAMRFTKNHVCLHTDASFLPRRPAARASWNYCIEQGDSVSVTYWLNRLMGHPGPSQFLVTLNPKRPIAHHHVIREYETSHPLFDVTAFQLQSRLPSLNRGCLAFAGAYFGYGFHEDGVRAGGAAAQALDTYLQQQPRDLAA